MAEWNWSGTVQYASETVVEARTVDEVRAAVARPGPLRTLGTRHSFSSIADTGGILIDVTGLPFDPVLDEDAAEVTVGAGTRYAVIASFLQERGWALANMGSLPHISVGGAISTGTHGSGDTLQNLSGSVRGLELLTPTGDLVCLRHNEPDFAGAVVGLGALGVLIRVTLAIQPSYSVRQEIYRGLTWEELLTGTPATVLGSTMLPSGRTDTIFGAGYSVSLFTDWVSPTVLDLLIKYRIDDPAFEPPETLAEARRLNQAELMARSQLEGMGNWTECGVPGPWCDRLPHFRIDATPSRGEEIQTEYFVPRERAGEAMAAMRAIGRELIGPLLITELRTVAADDLWLSPCYGQDCLGIHFTWFKQPDEVRARIPLIEETLAPFQARPHWGKVFDLDALDVDARYPKAGDFRRLAEQLDPDGRLRNDFLRRTIWR
ncbi:MAG: FAD-binding protein [Actinomycetales bacterium]